MVPGPATCAPVKRLRIEPSVNTIDPTGVLDATAPIGVPLVTGGTIVPENVTVEPIGAVVVPLPASISPETGSIIEPSEFTRAPAGIPGGAV